MYASTYHEYIHAMQLDIGCLKVALSDRGTSSATLTLVGNEWIGAGFWDLTFNTSTLSSDY